MNETTSSINRTSTAEGASLLRDVAYVVFKRKVVLIAFTLVGIAVMVYGLTAAVPTYEATARVYIKRIPQGYVMPSETRSVLKRGEVINSEINIIQSSAVAAAVVDRLEMATGEDRGIAIYDLERRIRAVDQPESDIIDISYRHRDAERAAAIVNAALDAYLEIRKSVSLNYDAVRYLDEQAERLKTQRDSVAMAIAEFGGESGNLAQGRRGEQRMGLQDRFNNELATLSATIEAREEQLAMVRSWLDSGADPAHIPSGEIYDMATVRQAKARLLDLDLELAEARSRYTADHPSVLKLERQIESTQSILRIEVEQALARQMMRLDEWKAERRAIVAMLEDLHSDDEDIMEEALTIRLLEHDLSIKADLYAIIMDRREQFRITAATDPNLLNVGIVARAAVPARPMSQPINMQIVVGLFTLVFGVLLMFVLERLDNSLERREDVQRTLGLKVLATIPDRR